MGLGLCRKSAISKIIFIDDNIIAVNGTGVVSSVYGIFLREIGSYRQIWRCKRMGKTMEHKISDALQPPNPQKSAQQNVNYVSSENTVKWSNKPIYSNTFSRSSTIVRPGQIPSSAQSPVSLNLVDIFDNLKRARGSSVRIDSDNSITIDVSK